MFRKYDPGEIPELSEERIGKIKASVMSRIEQEDAVKHISENQDNNIYQSSEPIVIKPSKVSPLKRIIPIAAAAAVLAVGVPTAANLYRSSDIGAASSGVSADFTSEAEILGSADLTDSEPVPTSNIGDSTASRFAYRPTDFINENEVLAFNGVICDVNEHGSISGDGSDSPVIVYDNIFKATGLAAEILDDGSVTLAETADSPDFYYGLLEFSAKVSKFAVAWDADGNIRVIIGDGIDDLKLTEEQLAKKFDVDLSDDMTFNAHEWMESALDAQSPIRWLRGEHLFKHGPQFTEGQKRSIIKMWYPVTEKGKQVLFNTRVDPNYVSVFETTDGQYEIIYSDNGAEFNQLVYNIYGMESPDVSGGSETLSLNYSKATAYNGKIKGKSSSGHSFNYIVRNFEDEDFETFCEKHLHANPTFVEYQVHLGPTPTPIGETPEKAVTAISYIFKEYELRVMPAQLFALELFENYEKPTYSNMQFYRDSVGTLYFISGNIVYIANITGADVPEEEAMAMLLWLAK